MQKILVTGATGFIGQAVVNTLHTQQVPVLAGVRHHSTAISEDITQIELGELATATDHSAILNDVDIIIHTAARAHILHTTNLDPLTEFRKVNTTGTLMLAQQAAAAGVKRFIFISSIKVNGESTHNGQLFTPELTGIPTDPYGLSKYEAEQGLMNLAKTTNMQVVIIRPPLVYGPGVKANFANLVKWIDRGIPLPFGAINNKRSLIALDNLVSFIIHCRHHPKAANEIFLVADESDISTTQLLQKVAQALGKKARLLPISTTWMTFSAHLIGKQNLSSRLFDSLQLDSSKAIDLLGWQPVVSIEEQLNSWLKEIPLTSLV